MGAIETVPKILRPQIVRRGNVICRVFPLATGRRNNYTGFTRVCVRNDLGALSGCVGDSTGSIGEQVTGTAAPLGRSVWCQHVPRLGWQPLKRQAGWQARGRALQSAGTGCSSAPGVTTALFIVCKACWRARRSAAACC